MSGKARAAVIGVGIMGRQHARVYSQIEGVDLVAVADIDEQIAQRIAGEYGVQYYTDHLRMLEEEKPDLVSLAVPTNLHHQLALDVIRKGRNLLIEKPIAFSVCEAEEIIGAAREQGIKLTIGHVERFNPAVQALRQYLESGDLGDIVSIVARRVGMFPPRVKDANVIVDLAIHDIDIINFLLGGIPSEVYVTAGYALLSDRFDHAELFLKYGEVGCFVQANWITPVKIRLLSVTGTRAHAEVNYITQQLVICQRHTKRDFDGFRDLLAQVGAPLPKVVSVVCQEPLRLELEAFLAAVQGERPIEVTGEDGLRALRIAEQAMEQLLREY